jgi:hypothetical protein
MLPELFRQIPPDQKIAGVNADGAQDTRRCHDAIAERGAEAVIPPRTNDRPRKTSAARPGEDGQGPARHRFEGGAERYQRRSHAETIMHCHNLLGQPLMARGVGRRVTELRVRVAGLNGCTALGIPVTKVAG